MTPLSLLSYPLTAVLMSTSGVKYRRRLSSRSWRYLTHRRPHPLVSTLTAKSTVMVMVTTITAATVTATMTVTVEVAAVLASLRSPTMGSLGNSTTSGASYWAHVSKPPSYVVS